MHDYRPNFNPVMSANAFFIEWGAKLQGIGDVSSCAAASFSASEGSATGTPTFRRGLASGKLPMGRCDFGKPFAFELLFRLSADIRHVNADAAHQSRHVLARRCWSREGTAFVPTDG